jgi:hypothetical protein
MAGLPDPGRSRAVLIGASTYRHLEDLPAVRNNLAGFRDVLVAPALGGLPADNCTVVAEPAEPRDLYRTLRQHAAAAEDTLLVYFAGHGRTGSRNELFLCLPDTEPDELWFTALGYERLREAVAESRATKKVVILDCCFSGRALADQAGDEETILGQVGIEGTYLLTATAANVVAMAPPGERYTAFTGTLLGLLTKGIPGGPELLTFGQIYPRLQYTLTSRQLPRPRQQGNDTITDLALTRNLAYTARAARQSAEAVSPRAVHNYLRTLVADVPSAVSAAQSEALTDSGVNSDRLPELINSIRSERLATLSLPLTDPPTQVDVFLSGRWPDEAIRGDVILVARGEMLLRVPAGGPPDPGDEPDVGAAEEVPPVWQRADSLLRDHGYTQTSPDFPLGLPLRKYVAAEGGVEELVRDRDRIRAETGAEVDLNYVVTAGHLGTDEYPRGTLSRGRYPPDWIRRHKEARDITVAVIDTGVNHQSRTDGWLTGIPQARANVDPLDVFPVREENGQIIRGDGLLDLSAGHGSFVAGIVQQVAPAATIVVYRAVDTEGMGKSDDVANAIVQAARAGADIINLSFGTMTVDGLPPLAFTIALDIVQAEHPDLLIVASAGNTGQETPMFPAAMNSVIGVGALFPNLTPAPWSNHGSWVNCSAVGVGIPSTFVEGDKPHTDADAVVTEHFGPDGWAIWSGTPFSAPQIAGAVAWLCQMNDITPRAALSQLVNGQPILPGYGHVVGV